MNDFDINEINHLKIHVSANARQNGFIELNGVRLFGVTEFTVRSNAEGYTTASLTILSTVEADFEVKDEDTTIKVHDILGHTPSNGEFCGCRVDCPCAQEGLLFDELACCARCTKCEGNPDCPYRTEDKSRPYPLE